MADGSGLTDDFSCSVSAAEVDAFVCMMRRMIEGGEPLPHLSVGAGASAAVSAALDRAGLGHVQFDTLG